jgi:PKD repeat protein
MKTITQKVSLLSILGLIAICLWIWPNTNNINREAYRKLMAEHPFSNPRRPQPQELKGMGKPAAPDLAWEQDYLRTMDPALGRPASERLASILATLNSQEPQGIAPGTAIAPWVERGPNNVGGRTRALAFDPSDQTNKKVWAGGVSGGLWYNLDITSAVSSWVPVNDFWQNIAISCIAFDPLNSSIIYVGTGEGYGVAASRGAGIWKSIDGGQTWDQLLSTQNFFYVLDIVIRNENNNSVIYAAVDGGAYHGINHGANQSGIQRSINGGNNWTNVSPTIGTPGIKMVAADLELASNGRIWAGSKAAPIWSSNRGGGNIFYSDNGTSWTIANTTTVTNGYGRVELACAPSNANTIYAVVENLNRAEVVKKSIDGGITWTNITKPVDADNGIPANDFTRGQAWYDLILVVDPNNANIAMIGGIDLFRTTNGGTSWNQISKWSNNNNLFNLPCSMVHADQHVMVYSPGSSSTLLFGNDGGVYYTNNISSAIINDVIFPRKTGYNVTQYYAGAIHPGTGSNIMIAGSQDNGTQRYAAPGVNSTNMVYGGDGGFCFIDQTEGNFQIASYVYNNFYRSVNTGNNFNYTLIDDDNTGKFINPADYDNQNNVLYTTKTAGSLYRVRNVTTNPSSAETITLTGMVDQASHISCSPYSSTIFVGSDAGEIFKVSNPNGLQTTVKISNSLPVGTISCIEVGANENELVVTYFNYGVNSVWYTNNGGISWTSKEGNLPDMPIRWALFNPNDRNEVIVATEIGVWACTNFKSLAPTWQASNIGLANVRVDMLQLRTSDNMVMAITHGRGVYTSNAFSLINHPVAAFSISKPNVCLGDTITLKDTSNIVEQISRNWTITPNTFQFIGGTNAQSLEPKVIFTANGNYSVQLKVTNSVGSDSLLKNDLIRIGGFTIPFKENWENSSTYNLWEILNPDGKITWNVLPTGGNGNSLYSIGIKNYEYDDAEYTPQRDGLISPQISLVGMLEASLSFKYAYRRFDNILHDSLAVYISTNCGQTWSRLASYRETQTSSPFLFITRSNLNSNFIPTSGLDWCGNAGFGSCKTINLNAYLGSTILIKFENISSFGNNLYIDDIEFNGITNEPPPVADFSSSTTQICDNSTVTFTDQTTSNPRNWQWSFQPNTIKYVEGTNSNSQNPKVQFLVPGKYSVSLIAANGNSSNQKVKTDYITITPSTAPFISISTNQTSICQGNTINFTSSITNGGANPTYQWFVNNQIQSSTSNSFSSNKINHGDTISCRLINNEACIFPSSVISNKIGITVNPIPIVTFALKEKSICYTTTPITLEGGWPTGGIYSGKGVNGNTFDCSIAGLGNHLITYTYINSAGCQKFLIDTLTIVGFESTPKITQNGNILNCDINTSSYQWYQDNQPIAGANNQTYTILNSGNYAVEVIDANACKSKSATYAIIKSSLKSIGGLRDLRILQIPERSEIVIEGSQLAGATLSILSINGANILETTLSDNAKNTIKMGELSKGIYLIMVRKGQEQTIKKIQIN